MAATAIKIQANVQWAAAKSPTSKRWLVSCEPLDLLLEADNQEEIPGLIQEAMQLLLTDLFRDQELDRFLKDRGWQAVGIPANPVGRPEFDVPYELIVRGNLRDSQHQAA